jgi:hypothetical protein
LLLRPPRALGKANHSVRGERRQGDRQRVDSGPPAQDRAPMYRPHFRSCPDGPPTAQTSAR